MSSSSRHTLLQAWYHTAFRSHVLLSQIPASRWNRAFSPKPSIRQVTEADGLARPIRAFSFNLSESVSSIALLSPSLIALRVCFYLPLLTIVVRFVRSLIPAVYFAPRPFSLSSCECSPLLTLSL